ncbi:MAG TPA: glutathione S-transferase family protein [Candidatus Binatia bacterium]|jgi:glutathione S-transferase
MKLYSGPLSLFTGKVRIALAEKGLDYERIEVPFSRAQGYTPKHPDVLKYNPKAQVPVLVDDDLVLYDSTLILEYLEERHPSPRLFPVDPSARARCRQAEAASDEILFPHVYTLILETFYKPEPERNAAAVAAARAAIASIYRELDHTLATRPYMCGDAFTVADIAYFLTIMFATSLGAAPDPGLGDLGAWSGRVGARPSVAAEMQGLMTASARA